MALLLLMLAMLPCNRTELLKEAAKALAVPELRAARLEPLNSQ